MLVLLSLVCFPQVVSAQSIVPDASLPQNSVVNTQNSINTITGGTQAGTNLFHSFEQFSVPTGSQAVFNNAADIANILGRVTGGELSDINGLIKANGDANLFLINPNGIILGENAALDIGGTFTTSTASSIKFADGNEFNAIAPENPILTVSLPTGVQLGGTPQAITVNGNGNNLFFNDFFAPDRSDKPTGLTGSPINLIAGEINFDGGNLTSSEINLAAVEAGQVGLTNNGFNLDAVASFGNINLTNAASVDASNGGIINATAKNISLADGSAVIALNEGDGTAGTINLNAKENLTLTGESAAPFPSFISTDGTEDATQTSGTINIAANHLTLDKGGFISATTSGEGDGGIINIDAQQVDVTSFGDNYSSSIIIDSGYLGKGGEINLNADRLNITQGGAIGSSSYGDGEGGVINLNAREIKVSDVAQIDDFIFGPYIAVNNEAAGKGGTLNITSDNLIVADSGQITASTSGTGKAGEINIDSKNITVTNATKPENYVTGIFNASGLTATEEVLGDGGDINIKAENLTVDNFAAISARSLSSANGGNIDIESQNVALNTGIINTNGLNGGNSGELTLNTNNLTLLNGGQISTSTNDNGNAGNLTINAQQIEVSGATEDGNSAILSNAIIGSGNGGNIKINTDGLKITDGGSVSVSNFSTRNANLPPGTGKPGTIEINAGEINVTEPDTNNPTGIRATVNAQSGGSITLNTNQLNLMGAGAEIDAQSKGRGNGGNITVNSSDINLANEGAVTSSASSTGDAGNITLNTQQLNGDRGLVIAESQVSGGGNIQINSDNLALNNESLLSTSVKDSNGGGGDITITNSNLILARNNSDLRANAVEGPGGNINITSKLLFTDFNSDIDASSRFGLDGTIKIESPESEKQLAPGVLPETIVDPTGLITAACPISEENTFTYTGNGGIPQNPDSNQTISSTWEDMRANIDPVTPRTSQGLEATKGPVSSSEQPTTPSGEAGALIKLADGSFELVATHPVASPLKSGCNYHK